MNIEFLIKGFPWGKLSPQVTDEGLLWRAAVYCWVAYAV